MNPKNPRKPKSGAFILLFAGLTLSISGVGEAVGAATPTPVPTATASASPAVAAATPPRYNGEQQSQYIATANAAFTAERRAKFQAFVDARTAFEAAGGIASQGLTSKAAVTERRDLLTKVRAANDDYVAFQATQNDTYKAELVKTPLAATDVDALVGTFAANPATVKGVKLQQLEKDLLTASDEMLGDLEKWDDWSVNAGGKLVFKKKANKAAYSAAEQKYNAVVAELQTLQAPPPTPSASPAASPAAPAAASPTATP